MKKNTKGMTLVEVIIAMCILGVLAAMFVTIAVRAKQENLYNLRRSNEMYEQAAFAESYNTDVKYGSNVKVTKLLTGGSSSDNKFVLEADFKSQGLKLTTEAYGYKVDRDKRNKDTKDGNYQLRFFRSEYGSIAEPPDPDNGKYCVRVYNDTGAQIEYLFFAQPLTAGRFFDDDGPIDSANNEINTTMLAGGKYEFGMLGIGAVEPILTMSHNENINTAGHVNDGEDVVFDSTTFSKYLEEKDGKITGYVIMHICSDGTIRNQAEFDSMGSEPSGT